MRHGEPRRHIALYSHDTQGLGHVRRNVELAAALVADDPATDVLLITGAVEACRLPLPPNTELVVLPSVAKDDTGRYSSATLRLPLDDLVALRAEIILAAVEGFAPDLLVVDKEARGLRGELDRTLARAPSVVGPGGRRMRLVLGLRDVLDAPDRVRREWASSGTTETVLTSYDQVWVYGDPAVHDLTVTGDLPGSVRELVRFTGYLGHGRGEGLARDGVPPASSPRRPHVLCTVGGGQDGAALASAFVECDLPAGHDGVLVTGPFMPDPLRTRLREAASGRGDLVVHEFLGDTLPLVGSAAAVVSMGGYNTVCEVLASGVPGLLVPRVRPRLEQAVRADALARHTSLDVCPPVDAGPGALTAWLAGAVTRPARAHAVDLDGLARVPRLAAELLEGPADSPRPVVEVRRATA